MRRAKVRNKTHTGTRGDGQTLRPLPPRTRVLALLCRGQGRRGRPARALVGKEIRAKVAIAKVANARDDVLLAVQMRVYLGRHNRYLGKLLVQRLDPLRAGDNVEEDNVLLLDAVLQQDLNSLKAAATRSQHRV
jgi:hypothetical protein